MAQASKALNKSRDFYFGHPYESLLWSPNRREWLLWAVTEQRGTDRFLHRFLTEQEAYEFIASHR